MEIKRYDDYIDSREAWLGQVPLDWTMVLLSQLVTPVKNKNIDLKEQNLLSLSYGKIKRKSIDSSGGLLPESFDGYNIIETNDIVLRLTDLQNDHTSLRVGLATEKGIITSAYTTLRPQNPKSAKFLYYLIHSFDIRKGFYGMGSGVRQGLNYDEVKKLKLPIPSVGEQEAIADYLDSEIVRIDSIISEAKASIEEYKAWKSSIIYEAVTQGLDPTTKMKDSGIVWLGNIPQTWSIPSVRNYFNINRGRVIAKTEISLEYEEGLYPIYSSQTKNNGCMGYIDTYDFEEESLTWTTDGANAGTVFYRDGKFNCTNVCGILTLKNKGQLWLPFCNYSIGLSAYNCRRADINGYKIMSNEMASIKFALPPTIEEQKRIADYLDEKCSTIFSLIDEKELLIADLEAYKKSLIFEVVTGKRKVV